MIRDIENIEKTKVSVYLKNGNCFLKKDITSAPSGEHDRIVCFWDDDIIKIFPIDVVEYWEYSFDE